MKILVTGAAGFIGSRLAELLLERGDEVVGIDNLNNYYDPSLKIARLARLGVLPPENCPMASAVPCTGYKRDAVEYDDLPWRETLDSEKYPRLRFIRLDITDKEAVEALFAAEKFDAVMNLAAQAGVRYSIENPMAYIESNILGFANLLEAARHNPVGHFVYASSSSVYGGNVKTPFAESDKVDNPVSLYAATKKSNELMAHVYSHLYGFPTTGLRFFTVYGPWGRPDMAPMLFANAISEGKPIKVFNHGDMSRDFTYVDDIVKGIIAVIDHPAEVAEGAQGVAAGARAAVLNIGCGRPMQLMDFIRILENALGKEAVKEMMPMQAGDVPTTFADTAKLEKTVGYKASTSLEEGVSEFAKWYKSFYKR